MKWLVVLISSAGLSVGLLGCGGGGKGESAADIRIEQDKQVVKTSTGMITGEVSAAVRDTVQFSGEGETTFSDPDLKGFYRFVRIVRNLRPGSNVVQIQFTPPGKQPEVRTVHITHDPTLDLAALQLLCIGNDHYSVVYTLSTGLPVAVLTDISNLVCWNNPEQALAVHNGSMVEYDILTLQPGRSIANDLRPLQMLNDGRIALCSNGGRGPILYDRDQGTQREVLSPSNNVSSLNVAVSQNARYAAWIGNDDFNLAVLFIKNLQTGVVTSLPNGDWGLEIITVGVADNADVVVTHYANDAGGVFYVRAGRITASFTGVDIMGESAFIDRFAYIGADGNPAHGLPTLYRFNRDTQRVEGNVIQWSGSVRVTPQGNLIAAGRKPMPYSYPVYHHATVFQTPGLTVKIECGLPIEATSLSVVGF